MEGNTHKVSETHEKAHQLLRWYSRLFSRRVDIIGDFAGSERFLIHGESLLLHCFGDSHLDFDPGFQLLHASYVVEKFLQGLISRQCNFHIAFFKAHEQLCVPQDTSPTIREKYLLARAAIIRHLQVNTQNVLAGIEVNVFVSQDSPEFLEYLQDTDLYFVLCHDGASFQDIKKGIILRNNLDALRTQEGESQKLQQQYKVDFRMFIYNMMQRGYSTALVNGLEWLDTKVMTTVLEPARLIEFDFSFANSMTINGAARDEVSPADLFESLRTIRGSSERSFSEREYLTLVIAAQLVESNSTFSSLIPALFQHTASLAELSLSERLVDQQSLPSEGDDFILGFCQEARKILTSTVWAKAFTGDSFACDVADLVDGRLFANYVHNPLTKSSPLYEALIAAFEELDDSESLEYLSDKSKTSTKPKSGETGQDSDIGYAVLPFSNNTFDEHLKPIHLTITRSGAKADPTTATIFRETAHWHNNKPLDSRPKNFAVKDPIQEKKALRRNQFFMAEMTSYAASLTNAVGKALEPEVITLGDKPKAAPPKSSIPTLTQETTRPKQLARQSTKNIKASKQAMLADIAANSKRKDEDATKQLYQAWGVFCDNLEKQTDLASRFNKAKSYVSTLNTDLKRKTLEAEVRFYMLNVLLRMWVNESKKDDKEDRTYIAALIFDNVKSLCALPDVTKTIATGLKTIVKRMQLPLLNIPNTLGDRRLPFKFVLEEVSNSDIALTMSPENFQLLHCGPYFDRTMDSAPDHRVPFEPDAWQRRVLDEIDARRSLLVIAPTSAGKTFISFYAMKQVLESNNDDVLVYVAPTKALVNQIAAEIQARFSKNYKYNNSVWGIHTRDYRINNPTKCQILVTVPHILQIMLLAPTNAKSWSERVKWIIFDEVHCIGQAEDGLIWEQLLLMAPCPIIALSATIGNAEAFNDWLVSTQRAAGHELVMVQHPHRYSDLRKFVFTPPVRSVEKSTDLDSYLPLPTQRGFAQLGLEEHGSFAFLHPVASLINRSRGIPSDFTLEARDCFTLWQSMSKHQTAEFPLDESLAPSAVLPTIIRKADIINWQSGLKAELTKWMVDDDSPFENVRKDLSKSIVDLAHRQHKESPLILEEESEDEEIDIVHDVESILPLLADLQRQDALPGIIFNYDRAICERMCQTLMKQLSDAEAAWKLSSPKWKTKLKEWDDWKKEMAKREKQGVRGANKGLTKQDQMREAASQEVSQFASFDPNKPIDGFHFADNKKLSHEELEEQAKQLRRRGVDEWLIDCLRRGIGVHHAGLNRKYRYCVEMLFRRGYLRVVIATGTLALGINMPCKTVVFSGDSVFLTALNFRQAAGRAGRRGFDMLGNVVFHGVSIGKVHKLISSRLPDLNGHFPITTTLILRLFTLLHSSEDAKFAVRCVNALLSQPRLYLGGAESKMTVLHHLRFSIEYLRRQQLLDSQGIPLNFAGCVSHLYFTENSSFAFHALLKDGYFHELCARIDTNKESVLRELMLTMAHLFGRQYCRQADEDFIQEIVKRSPSMVFLPAMPENAVTILRRHNKVTLDIFTAYVRTFVDQHVKETESTLPFTSIKIGGKPLTRPVTDTSLRSPPKARSLFVALSGHNDTFDSIHDLCSTSRAGVFLEEAVVPHVGVYPEDSELPLNAYLFDFYNHGDVNALRIANKIRRGDVWFVLNDFSMILATIVTSLAAFMNLAADGDTDFTDVRGGGDEDEEKKEDKFIPDDSAQASGSSSAATASSVRFGASNQELTLQPKKKAKKKVVDSWDDEESEEEEVEESWDDGAEDGADGEPPAWEEGSGLINVLKAFKGLKEEFDTKFRAMWA